LEESLRLKIVNERKLGVLIRWKEKSKIKIGSIYSQQLETRIKVALVLV
jgi:hypothetical protein